MRPGNVVDVSKIKPAHFKFLENHDRSFAFILDDERLTAAARHHIVANAAFRTRTGHLAGSTQVRTMRTKNRTLIRFTNDAKYAWAQNSGSGIHGPKGTTYPIVPRRKGVRFLRFFDGGQLVFRRKVMHPGVPATHFLQTATAVAFRTNLALLRAAMQRNAKRF